MESFSGMFEFEILYDIVKAYARKLIIIKYYLISYLILIKITTILKK